MNLVTRAHNAYLQHIMGKPDCCAASHGRHCPTGARLWTRYQTRYWADYVLRGKTKLDRQLRLKSAPEAMRGRVHRLALALFALRRAS